MITSERRDDVCWVTIDRPQRRNALTPAGLDELAAAVEAADEPVLCLRGAGEAFCAGADLDVVDDLAGDDAADFAERGQAVARRIATYDGATVAAVDGATRGGGLDIALACDVRVCTPASTFAASGVSIGLLGAWGGTVRLPEVVGSSAGRDLALSGRVLDAEAALATGLVSRVVDDPGGVARDIAANDHEAVRSIARRLRDDGPVDAREERERAVFADLVRRRNS